MITIRQAVESDIKQICRLGQNVPEFSVNSETVSFWPQVVIQDIIRSPEAILLVAEEGVKIRGFIIANCNKAFKKVTVENIYVSPKARNTGIGQRLLSYMLSLAEESGYEYVATLIPAKAQEAAMLYTDSGFTKGETFQWFDKTLGDNFKSK